MSSGVSQRANVLFDVVDGVVDGSNDVEEEEEEEEGGGGAGPRGRGAGGGTKRGGARG